MKGILGAKLSGFFGSHMGMMVLCCAAMVAAIFMFSGSEASALSAWAPLLACVGMHLVMHKFMGHGEDGKSCHGSKKTETPKESSAPALEAKPVPVRVSQNS